MISPPPAPQLHLPLLTFLHSQYLSALIRGRGTLTTPALASCQSQSCRHRCYRSYRAGGSNGPAPGQLEDPRLGGGVG